MNRLLEKLGGLWRVRKLAGEGVFRNRIFAIALLVLTNLAVAALWTYPRWQVSGRARVEDARIAAARGRLVPVLEEVRDRYGRVLEAEAELAILKKRINAASGTTADAVESLHRVVADAGLEAGRFAYRPEVIDELGLLELQATLPVTGSYASLRNLIFTFEGDAIFTAIDTIQLASAGRGGAVGPLTIDLSLSIFVADPEEHPGRASANGAGGRRGSVADARNDRSAQVEEIRATLTSLAPQPGSPNVYDVHIEGLEKAGTPTNTSTRNPFAFEPAPRPTPSPTPEQPPEEREPAAATSSPSPPRVAYRLIGIVDMSSGRRATLVDGTELYVVVVGDELPSGIRVASVGMDYVELDVYGNLMRLTLEIERP